MEKVTVEAMSEGAKESVRLDELQVAASKIIAQVTHAEAGIVTTGAAAALTLGTAACIAGLDAALMNRLPDTVLVKFHDGTDFNAEACKWNLDQYRVSVRVELKNVASVDIIDDYTVRLSLSKWDNTIINNLGFMAGMMISPTAFEKAGTTDEERIAWCEKNPVTTGPFKFVSWERDVKQVYERFDDYWQEGKPYLDGFEWVFITDPMTAVIAFTVGEVDVLAHIEPKDANDLQASMDLNIASLPTVVDGFVFDSANPDSPFADVRVRRAAYHAIDTKAIVDALSYGFYPLTNQCATPGNWAYNPDVVGYPYNPEKAKQLLAEAGYPDGFKTKLIPLPPTIFWRDATTAVQGYLKAMGIDAEVELLEYEAALGMVLGGGWEGMLWASITVINPDQVSAMARCLSGRGILWPTMLHPDDYEEALTKAIEARDFETKKKWTHEAQRLMVDKYCLNYLAWCETRIAVSHPEIRDLGINEIPYHFTPADAWIERK